MTAKEFFKFEGINILLIQILGKKGKFNRRLKAACFAFFSRAILQFIFHNYPETNNAATINSLYYANCSQCMFPAINLI
jgi:hypothetical protein